MLIGVPKEIFPGERRVAIAPVVLPALAKAGFEVILETGAGVAAACPDEEFRAKGARIASTRAEVFKTADLIAQVLCYGSNMENGRDDLPLLRKGQFLVGFMRPLDGAKTVQEIAATGAVSFALELMPRITRAQSMDALSSMATLCGYQAVIRAAYTLPRIFPMLTTAAGTVTPARVLIIGAGVAGLQAIATARRLGAVASAYDLRPDVKEQVLSVGGRFVELPIEASNAQDERGYARAQDKAFYDRQRELLGKVVAEHDVVITAAVVPGRKPPLLLTREMVHGMEPGSVIVDLAAERGGNCELTRANEIVAENGVSVIGTINLASSVPYHASQLYARNITNFVTHVFKGGKPDLNPEDEITRETLLTQNGEVVNKRVREFFAQSAPSAS